MRQYFLRLAAGLERGLNPIGCRVVKELCEEFEISCDQDWKRDEFKEERRSKDPGNYYSYGQFDHDLTHTTLTWFPSGCAWLGLIKRMNGLEIV